MSSESHARLAIRGFIQSSADLPLAIGIRDIDGLGNTGTMSSLRIPSILDSVSRELTRPMDAPNLKSAYLFLQNLQFLPTSPHLSMLQLSFDIVDPVPQSELLQRLSEYPDLVELYV